MRVRLRVFPAGSSSSQRWDPDRPTHPSPEARLQRQRGYQLRTSRCELAHLNQQTRVPSIVGLNYGTAETTLLKANLRIRILANRYDLPLEPGLIISQSPQAGEMVGHGTFIGVAISREDPDKTPH